MKDIFKRTTNSIICSSIIACIIGFIIALNPSMSLKTIGIIMAIYIILYGIVLIILDASASKYYVPFDGLLSGILSIIVGIILLGKPNVLSIFFTIAIGVWICLSSIDILKMAIAIKKEDSPWVLLFLLGILDLIAGLIVAFNPFEASISITVFAGIMIIIHSVISIIDIIIIKKNAKKIEKTVKAKLKELQ